MPESKRIAAVWHELDYESDLFEHVLDHVAQPIFVKDRSFRWIVLNQAFAQMVGHPREELLGKTDYDFFPKHEADFFRAKDLELFASEAVVIINEEELTDRRGHRHVLQTTKTPLRDRSGRVTHLVGIIHDITRQKLVEEELRLLNEQLEKRILARTSELEATQQTLVRKERLAVLGQLAGGVAHQIRNPLGIIKNAAALLQREAHSFSAIAERSLAIIHEEVWRANRIVTDLLDYARIRPPIPRAIEVRVLIESALTELAGSPIRLTVDIADDVFVAVDPDQVRSAFENLVRNALDAMPHGGSLSISAKEKGDFVLIAFRDSGDGVDASVRDKLFEPLITSKPLGLGLGLTTTKTLIENQGGRIYFESRPSQGTTFFIEFLRLQGPPSSRDYASV